MKTETRYIASDNIAFNSAAERQAHEKEIARRRKTSLEMKSYVANDYADIHFPNGASFYYGYEVEQNGEWCFRAQWVNKQGAKRETIMPFSELDARDQYDCAECLLEGIAKLFESGALVFTE